MFHLSPLIGKPRMTPLSFVKITISYEVCRWIIQGLPNRQKRASVPGVCSYGYIQLSHPGNIDMRSETTTTTGGSNYRIGPDCAGRA